MPDQSSQTFADFVEALRYPTGAARGSEWQAPEMVAFPPGLERRLEAFARTYERRDRRIFGHSFGPPAKAPMLVLTDLTRAQELFVLDWLVTRLSLRRYSFDPREFRGKDPAEISTVIAPLYEAHAAIVHMTGADGVPWAWTRRALESRAPSVCVIATATSGAALDPGMLAAFGSHIAWTDDDGRTTSGAGALSPHS